MSKHYITKEDIDKKNAFCVKINNRNSYWHNEEEFIKYSSNKELRNKMFQDLDKLITSNMNNLNIDRQYSRIRKEFNRLLELYGEKVISSAIENIHIYIPDKINNSAGRVGYFLTIFKGSVEESYKSFKQHKQLKEIHTTYTTNEDLLGLTINNKNKKINDDISEFLED